MNVDSIAAGLWMILFFGLCLVMWRMERKIQDLEACLDAIYGLAEQAGEAAGMSLIALQAHLEGKPMKIVVVPLRQDDRE